MKSSNKCVQQSNLSTNLSHQHVQTPLIKLTKEWDLGHRLDTIQSSWKYLRLWWALSASFFCNPLHARPFWEVGGYFHPRSICQKNKVASICLGNTPEPLSRTFYDEHWALFCAIQITPFCMFSEGEARGKPCNGDFYWLYESSGHSWRKYS